MWEPALAIQAGAASRTSDHVGRPLTARQDSPIGSNGLELVENRQEVPYGSTLSISPVGFGGYVNVLVTKNMNAVGPTWTLTHFKGPGNFGAVSEVNTDKLVFAFAEGSDVGKPYSVFRTAGFAKAKQHLDSINLNQLTHYSIGHSWNWPTSAGATTHRVGSHSRSWREFGE